MSSYISFVNLGVFQREFLQNYLVYRAQLFRDNWNCYALSIFRNFILLVSKDNDKPMLMRLKCKQGFAFMKGNFSILCSQHHDHSATDEENRLRFSIPVLPFVFGRRPPTFPEKRSPDSRFCLVRIETTVFLETFKWKHKIITDSISVKSKVSCTFSCICFIAFCRGAKYEFQ